MTQKPPQTSTIINNNNKAIDPQSVKPHQLPDNFNPTEFLQNVVRYLQNKIVKDEFNDLGEDWQLEIKTNRGAIRTACTHQDADSIDMTLLRLYLYYFILRKAKDLMPNIYGIPVYKYQEMIDFPPQVLLVFQQDYKEMLEKKYTYQLEAEISFRLMKETSETITNTEIIKLANKIKAVMKGYTFTKGRIKVNYFDKKNGYRLSILAQTEAEGKEVIKKVLSIQGHTFDGDFCSVSHTDKNYNEIKYVTILTKKTKLPTQRKVGNVKFKTAFLKIHGIEEDIALYDTSGNYPGAKVRY